MVRKRVLIVVSIILLAAVFAGVGAMSHLGFDLSQLSGSVKSYVGGSGSDHVVYITNTGKKYHSRYCRYLKDSCIEISIEDAEARGYDPCSRCAP